MNTTNQTQQKNALRARILAARDALSEEQRRAASLRIAQQIMAQDDYRRSRRRLLFLPFASEWNAELLVRDSLAGGQTVVLPRVDKAGQQLLLHVVEDIERDTVPGVFGIREPRATLPLIAPNELDWVLAPGLVFTRDGCRMGYGKGYFDRLLILIAPHVPVVAGAFAVQIVDRLPMEAHDRKVGRVVSE